ncbi:16S rRNA (adenine(1518)-N(6)/adenine(1519)-N(6))-dimethyltransferase RsmA [Parvularcula sp. LCG005]|uniref:16S rRNA (adenine(1518)-N(6)/adenine(1519)-N(6))- dimethyltransferase RsmA n=1 Tax=Parvularcula sp. LCG005 TaxID=3078805 RepID=UPI002941D09C|nr:16S rRNA (adenine(1518)-N(6)/adenine(1519)-N(6))-dimethyltransferase RsmA [Parvularcula sp. LCG005]WOI52734.1 16S rRNA (adenine(1518)-N(6)/adenine(1519)-N(6))-dimethyltransferase RsmA [Parvularcula sp. LCG005]
MTPTQLPPLRDVIAEHGLAAKKGLGQHFLLDLNLTRKIARLTGAAKGDHILEIGPGPGGLTRALLETEADLTTIERDARIAPILEDLAAAYPGQLSMVETDALAYDEQKIVDQRTTYIASNLPYNISTELLVKWLTVTPRWWQRMVLMFQREVADRILAAPGSKTYGRLSVIAQAASRPSLGFHLPARAFTPPPKVDSSVVVFDTLEVDPIRIAALEKVTAAAFGQRRKMIRASLKPLFGEAVLKDALDHIGLEETLRAETLSVDQFLQLADALMAARKA